MSDDIVERLRDWSEGLGTPELCDEAADEIEWLRAWQTEARAELVDIRSQWGDDYIWRKYNEQPVLKLLDDAQ